MSNLLHKVTEADIQRLILTVAQNDVPNEYHEYFDYDIHELDIESPKDWRDAYQLYCKLMNLWKWRLDSTKGSILIPV